jgi:hypothetical protein
LKNGRGNPWKAWILLKQYFEKRERKPMESMDCVEAIF